MKLFQNTAILANGLLLAAMLGACQHENDHTLTPLTSENVSDRNAKTSNIERLIKDGDKDLQYVTDGFGRQVLTKVIDHGANAYYKYTYSAQSIVEDKFQLGNDKPVGQNKYKLNAIGKCSEMILGGNVYILEYSVDGQLTRRYNKNSVNERIEFEYLPDSNYNSKSLNKMTFFNAGNVKIREVLFNYNYLDEPVQSDLTQLNPEYFAGTSRYLPVFGKFNTYLLRISHDNWTGSNVFDLDLVYHYALNPAGLPTSIDKSILGDNDMPVTTQRKYFSQLAGQ